MELFIIPFLFLLGLIMGSFLLVLSDRLPRNENVLIGRSYCESCKKELDWYELIPVFSFVMQKGKCRKCRTKLSGWYPVAELVTAMAFVLPIFLFPESGLFFYLFFLSIVSVLIVIFIADWKYGIIPFPMVLIGIITTFLYYLFLEPSSLLPAFITAIASGLFFFLIFFFTKGQGMGFGDVVYAFFMGWFLGFPGIIVGLYLAFLTGGIVSLILVLLKRKKLRGDTIAFGPFLVMGTLLAFIFEDYFIVFFTGLF